MLNIVYIGRMKYHLYFVLNRCRELYNAALSERKDAYRMAGKSITYFD